MNKKTPKQVRPIRLRDDLYLRVKELAEERDETYNAFMERAAAERITRIENELPVLKQKEKP